MNIKREHLFIIIIVSLIIIAGSGIIIWKTLSQNEFITAGLQDESNYISDYSKQEKEESTGDSTIDEQQQEIEKIYVHITGAVKNCGVYKLKEGARVIDVLEAAGGGSKEAVLEKINLAAAVYDGDQIYIPAEGDLCKNDEEYKIQKSVKSLSSSNNKLAENNGRININIANRSQLEELPGIGPSKAQCILDYRRKIGKFDNYQQLLSVKGIGEKTLDKIKKELSLR